jgi:tetratricopeptide (TPR) repeat protein
MDMNMDIVAKLIDESRFEEALALIFELKKMHTDPYIYVLEAIAQKELGQFENAITSSLIAIRAFPCIETYNLLTNIYIECGRHKEALRNNDLCLKLFKQVGNLRVRTQILMVMEEFSKAIKNSKRVLKLNPTDPLIYFDISMCYASLRKYDDAYIYINKALVYGQTPDLYKWRSLVESLLGRK